LQSSDSLFLRRTHLSQCHAIAAFLHSPEFDPSNGNAGFRLGFLVASKTVVVVGANAVGKSVGAASKTVVDGEAVGKGVVAASKAVVVVETRKCVLTAHAAVQTAGVTVEGVLVEGIVVVVVVVVIAVVAWVTRFDNGKRIPVASKFAVFVINCAFGRVGSAIIIIFSTIIIISINTIVLVWIVLVLLLGRSEGRGRRIFYSDFTVQSHNRGRGGNH